MHSYPVYTAMDVADCFVRLALREGKPLTNMKVQKLTYIAYGYWLGFTNYQLFQEAVEAWQYGPVIRELYYQLAHYGANLIQQPLLSRNPIPENSDAYRLIETVYDRYKDLTAGQLSWLTHQNDTPWSNTWNLMGNRKGIIAPDTIRDYYRDKMITREPAE